MSGSGLEEVWRQVYAENTFPNLKKKAQLTKTNQTLRLWVQLLDYVGTILLFIRAERLRDWEIHFRMPHMKC